MPNWVREHLVPLRTEQAVEADLQRVVRDQATNDEPSRAALPSDCVM